MFPIFYPPSLPERKSSTEPSRISPKPRPGESGLYMAVGARPSDARLVARWAPLRAGHSGRVSLGRVECKICRTRSLTITASISWGAALILVPHIQ